MGYSLQAIIARQQTLSLQVSEVGHARIVHLAQGMSMVPLTEALRNEIDDSGPVDRFDRLSPGVVEWVRRLSIVAPTAYIEAEFFGGVGGQCAVAWSGGKRVLGPIYAPHAINEVLRFFGIRPDGAYDEFDAVGLGLHRNTEDWISPTR